MARLHVSMETRPSLNQINPYLGLIFCDPAFTHLVDLSIRRPFSTRISGDVYHMHWPDQLLSLPKFHRFGPSIDLAYQRLVRGLDKFKRRGGKVVWTAHNLFPHDLDKQKHQRIWRRWQDEILMRVDAVIAMSPAVETVVKETHPLLQSCEFKVIPHPHYQQIYAEHIVDRATARHGFGLPQNGPVIGMLGLVRAYKDPLGFVRTFLAAQCDGHLLLAGKCYDDALRSQIKGAVDGQATIAWLDQELSTKEFVEAACACDLIAFNFSATLNSGSLFAALSLARPVLAPDTGATPDIAAQVGRNWVHTFHGELSADALNSALVELPNPQSAEMPDLTRNAPAQIARQHVDLYNALVG